jgi:hypothetical protein
MTGPLLLGDFRIGDDAEPGLLVFRGANVPGYLVQVFVPCSTAATPNIHMWMPLGQITA